MRHDDITDNKVYCRCFQTFQCFLAIGRCVDGIGISQILSQKFQHIRRIFHNEQRVTAGFGFFFRSGTFIGHRSDGVGCRNTFL